MSRLHPDPWLPMADPLDVALLGKLAEEASELATAANRCMIQGIDEVEPETKKLNREWLEDEIADVLAGTIATLDHFRLDRTRVDRRVEQKHQHLLAWHRSLLARIGACVFGAGRPCGARRCLKCAKPGESWCGHWGAHGGKHDCEAARAPIAEPVNDKVVARITWAMVLYVAIVAMVSGKRGPRGIEGAKGDVGDPGRGFSGGCVVVGCNGSNTLDNGQPHPRRRAR